jgi:hypothetical protein
VIANAAAGEISDSFFRMRRKRERILKNSGKKEKGKTIQMGYILDYLFTLFVLFAPILPCAILLYVS